MTEENISQEFGLKNIDEVRNYFNKQKNQNELMSKKHKNVCRVLNYMKQLLILVSTITGCCFYFCFCFFSWYSCRCCEFCSRIKYFCNNSRNQEA